MVKLHKSTFKGKELIDAAERGADVLINTCGCVKRGDKVLIIFDSVTTDVGECLAKHAKKVTDNVELMITQREYMHGIEPPHDIARSMLQADVIYGLRSFSLVHTNARMNATKRGARYLSLPDYSIEQLKSPAMNVDFFKWRALGDRIKNIMTGAKEVRITTRKGTDLTLDISGRETNFWPCICDKPGDVGAPPDIETNTPPVEEKSRGTLVVDGSIPCSEIGLVKEDIVLEIEDGSIKKINSASDQGMKLASLMELDTHPKRGILAEFGIGLNPEAELCGRMLEDEGCLGTVHFGFGSNAMIGGKNDVDFHLDFVIKNPTVLIDNIPIMDEGNLLTHE
ncbi:MAG: hypothetical protein ABIG55_03430 [Candidatus Omnitrophota bacterium]|nr:hypothetical protein [Candidatus Omnitrophota bacterium]